MTEELESPVIQNSLARWEEVSAVVDGPAAERCMHELRDSIKKKWGEIYIKENPQNSSDEDTYSSRRRARNRTAAIESTATTTTAVSTTTGTNTSNTTVTTATTTTATPTPSTASTTQTTTSRVSSEVVAAPTTPHPSDQALPTSLPEPFSSSVGSSLRQVTDTLAQNVTTREEQSTELDTAVTDMEGVVETSISTSQEQNSSTGLTTSSARAVSTEAAQIVPTLSSPPLVTTTSSSTHPIMTTFDGTQESAVASLATTSREDPLYTFLSAVAGAPAPPNTNTPSSEATPITRSSTELPRLSVLPTTVTDSTAEMSTSESTPPSAIRTPVIQDPRPPSLATLSQVVL